MVKLYFKTTEEFETLFRNNNKRVTDGIVLGIEKAMMSNRNTAELFEISFEQAEMVYEIALPQSQWVPALENCLDFYHRENEADAAIDTWKLLESAKAW